jgi:hypothetical protein
MKRTRAFHQLVCERGQKLRLVAYQRLTVMKNESVERITVGRRKGTIATFCEISDGERVAVVLRGKLDTRFSRIKSVARDGFYKHRDGSVTDMRMTSFMIMTRFSD